VRALRQSIAIDGRTARFVLEVRRLAITNQGPRTRELGLREGKIVVVRESVQDDPHEQPSRIDWDVLVRSTKARYPTLLEKPRKTVRELVVSELR
jgi:hypothetical protein